MDNENYRFLNELAGEEKEDLSKAVRQVVSKGRLMLALEKYKKGEVSLGRAAELAQLSIGRMITLLSEYGVESNLEKEDYLTGLENLKKIW
jgi:predicted HTH domain antitoxin